jgi:hypothetical protein
MIHPARRASWLLCPLLALAGVQAHAQGDVTIYRCTDAQGRLTIGNTPCAQGQQQQTRNMLRPKDAPQSAVVPEEDEPVETPQPVAARMVVTTAPRALYECVRPDGSVYESDSGDGDPRWVPLWTLGYPGDAVGYGGMVVQHDRGGSRSGGMSAPRSAGISAPHSSGISAPSSSSISIPPPWERPRQSAPLPRPRPPRPGFDGDGFGYGYGTWVRDECYALPQGEVCARLSDRRDELRRRFFNAQQRERDALRVEERGLNARLVNDCGIN